ncbi:hypothetical protein ACKKBG_A08675 [Auxenochlorella protothecoides x Auxenochlorella symbiontica]
MEAATANYSNMTPSAVMGTRVSPTRYQIFSLICIRAIPLCAQPAHHYGDHYAVGVAREEDNREHQADRIPRSTCCQAAAIAAAREPCSCLKVKYRTLRCCGPPRETKSVVMRGVPEPNTLRARNTQTSWRKPAGLPSFVTNCLASSV